MHSMRMPQLLLALRQAGTQDHGILARNHRRTLRRCQQQPASPALVIGRLSRSKKMRRKPIA